MKKLFTLAVALVAMASSAMALDNEPKEGISTEGFLGFNTTTIRGINDLPGVDYKGKIGGFAGFKVRYVLPKAHGTYINAGVDWTQKGAKWSDIPTTFPLTGGGTQDTKATDKINLHYIEIPIHVGFLYNFTPEIGVFGEVGPYFAIGIAGKHKFSLEADGADARAMENSYAAFKKSTVRENFQRWDAGIGFRVGAEYNQHYLLALGMDWGLTDMWRDDYRDAVAVPGVTFPKIKNYNFTIALGYRF